MEMMLKIRNVRSDWSSTDGPVHYYDKQRPCKKETLGEESVFHPGWTVLGGFAKITYQREGVNVGELKHGSADSCFLEHYKGDCNPRYPDKMRTVTGVRITLKKDAKDLLSIVILANTEIYLLNENGQTIEKLW